MLFFVSIAEEKWIMFNLLNFILFQVNWFSCVLSAKFGVYFIGVIMVGISAVFHVYKAKEKAYLVRFFLWTIAFGAILDTLLINYGVMSFSKELSPHGMVPAFMIAMWLNFATTLDLSMSWIKNRYGVAVILGFFGGPMAYYGGYTLGVLQLDLGIYKSLFYIGLEWALAMILLLFMKNNLSNGRKCYD